MNVSSRSCLDVAQCQQGMRRVYLSDAFFCLNGHNRRREGHM